MAPSLRRRLSRSCRRPTLETRRPRAAGPRAPKSELRLEARTCAMNPHALLPALCSVAILGASAVASLAESGAYPSRYVSIIIQTAAGSGPDVIARIVADGLTQSWGQQ